MAETRATTNNEKTAALATKFEGHDVTLLEMKQQLGVIAQFMQKMDQRLSSNGASYLMEGEALIWFQDAENSGLFSDWEAFVKAVHVRFGATSYDDPMESLTRLKQASSVIAYGGQFEAISNRVRSLSEPHKLSCFLSGLKDEVRLPVRMLGPKNLNEAFGLAKMQEEYLWSCRRSSKIPHDGSRPSISISTSDSRTKVSLQRLTAAQMEERRKKGLCYHCDEKWQSGHQCKGARIFLLEGVSFSQELPSSGPQLVELEANGFVVLSEGQDVLQDSPEITLYALVGSPSPGTTRIEGKIQRHCLVILIDTGSTHNFLDAGLCSSLKLAIDPALAFDVKIANGATVKTLGACQDLQVQVQGHHFCMDLNVLPLGGCDLVLGTQWLRTLGLIQWDFNLLTMAFQWLGKTVVLKGLRPSHSSLQDASQFFKKPAMKGLLLQITAQLFTAEPTLPVLELESLLEEFAAMFEKTEIEKIVKELLEVGSIRPSQSPFSSLVLVVGKANGSWQMCIDYRALNQVTIKDKFPIPAVDELLHELCGSMIFSKLDIRSGYHQIRMKAEDVLKLHLGLIRVTMNSW
ncbi:uncharacterized protein LOC112019466 [Quercus suber]|uniref:uncharacterized protein LOC112019466 n=1 Tax=Quercus suber TaxID=58331 RepID=UPI000CE1683B|nr:uncharacterized protein LOC112019466 [Quercus suber]